MIDISVVLDDPQFEPRRASTGAAGFDLSASGRHTLPVGGRRLIPTGVRIAIPDGLVGLVVPRSGWAHKHGVTVLNAPGTIDSDYRGEVGVILHNTGEKPITIERGDRIAQLLILPITTPNMQIVDSLDDTQRGQGGYGHTGGMQ